MIVGLCSTYREGRLAETAVRSLLEACDAVVVNEGAIGDADELGQPSDWNRVMGKKAVRVIHAPAPTDADKRTAMLKEAHRIHGPRLKRGEPMWGVVLDGDELLLHGDVLPEYFDALPPDALGFSLHLMELDGSCSYIPNRIVRLDQIERWVISSYAFMLTSGITVSKPNVPILAAGEVDSAEWVDMSEGKRQKRRPLQGEPHILHRSVLRSPERQRVQRQHMAEVDSFERIVGAQPVGDAVAPGGSPIWLPGT